MPENAEQIVIAIGTWTYDGLVPKKIELHARPAKKAASRYIEDEETGDVVIDDRSPIPETADGYVYYVGATSGGEFLSAQDAIAWADKQPWGPVSWAFLRRPQSSA